MKILIIPDEISKTALLSIIPCVTIGIYMAYRYRFVGLCIMYGILLVTSLLYWTDTGNKTILYTDISFALIILLVKSIIAIKYFTGTFKILWFSTLCIMGVSFMINREILQRKLYDRKEIDKTTIGNLIDKYIPVKKTDNVEEIEDAYNMSTKAHMITIHVLATIVFVSGLLISCRKG